MDESYHVNVTGIVSTDESSHLRETGVAPREESYHVDVTGVVSIDESSHAGETRVVGLGHTRSPAMIGIENQASIHHATMASARLGNEIFPSSPLRDRL